MFYFDNKAGAISAFLRKQSSSFLKGWSDYEKYRGDEFQQALCCEVENMSEYNSGWDKRKRIDAI